ncbi:MAG: hypothetical protein ACO3N7_07540 [Kiritimatiellia bacterium]
MRAKFCLLLLSFLSFISLPLFSQATHSIGIGAHYWRVIDDLEVDNFEESGLSYLGVYRYDGGLLALQTELEVFPSDFGASTEQVYSPQVLAILGDGIYAAIGAGILYSDGEFADKPYYLLRAGLNIIAFGPLTLDINANYLFTDFDNLSSSDIDSDTITLGAMLRWEFE